MKKTKISRFLSVILCVVLIAAVALFASGCTDKNNQETPDGTTTSAQAVQEIGKGEKAFEFSVTDGDGNEARFRVHTDKAIVGDALQELGLISGDEGPYGLYVKTVNGKTYDYDTDKMYWAFYVNGEYASSSVDATEIAENAVYSFRAEK